MFPADWFYDLIGFLVWIYSSSAWDGKHASERQYPTHGTAPLCVVCACLRRLIWNRFVFLFIYSARKPSRRETFSHEILLILLLLRHNRVVLFVPVCTKHAWSTNTQPRPPTITLHPSHTVVTRALLMNNNQHWILLVLGQVQTFSRSSYSCTRKK